MPRNSRLVVMIVLMLVVIGCTRADAQPMVIVLETNDPTAHVFVDDRWQGIASQGVFALEPGKHDVRLVPAQIGTWSVSPRRISVSGGAADTVDVLLDFPYTYRLESAPYRTEVQLGDESLGMTPVDWRSDHVPSIAFRFRTADGDWIDVRPGARIWNRHIVTLPAASAATDVWLQPAAKRRRWIDVAAVGAAVIGGIVAVRNKQQADRLFDTYSETGDPLLRPRINRYDRRSAVGVGFMQAGFAVFAVRLALR